MLLKDAVKFGEAMFTVGFILGAGVIIMGSIGFRKAHKSFGSKSKKEDGVKKGEWWNV